MNSGHFKRKYWVGQKFIQVFHKMLQKNPNFLANSIWSTQCGLESFPLPTHQKLHFVSHHFLPKNSVPITTSLPLLWEGSWCIMASPTEADAWLSERSGCESRSINNNPDFLTLRLEDTGARSNCCSAGSPWKWDIWVSSTPPHSHCMNTPNITSCRNQQQRNLFPSYLFWWGVAGEERRQIEELK